MRECGLNSGRVCAADNTVDDNITADSLGVVEAGVLGGRYLLNGGVRAVTKAENIANRDGRGGDKGVVGVDVVTGGEIDLGAGSGGEADKSVRRVGHLVSEHEDRREGGRADLDLVADLDVRHLLNAAVTNLNCRVRGEADRILDVVDFVAGRLGEALHLHRGQKKSWQSQEEKKR